MNYKLIISLVAIIIAVASCETSDQTLEELNIRDVQI